VLPISHPDTRPPAEDLCLAPLPRPPALSLEVPNRNAPCPLARPTPLLAPSPSPVKALLRRLEKRILVPLPNVAARRAMFSTLLTGRCAADVSWDLLAERTEGYR
jgi:hypothetical protein